MKAKRLSLWKDVAVWFAKCIGWSALLAGWLVMVGVLLHIGWDIGGAVEVVGEAR